MSDNNRRSGNNSNDFDWDAYDSMTSQQSDAPLSRRNRSSGGSRSVRRTPQSQNNTKRKSEASPSRSKRNKRKRRKKQLSEKQLLFRKRLRTAVLITCLLVAVVIGSVAIGMYAAVSREIKDMNIKNLALNSTSFIYYTDSSGTEQQLEQIQSDEKRIWVESSQIPDIMKQAMVSIEDERFYKHHGVDMKRTLGATVKYVLAKVGIGNSNYGGSTITQQVIKNITNETEKTSMRKIKEMMRAVALENQLTKDEILMLYLNIVYFANGCNGVEAASNVYFAKSASELTLPEAASIAGITQYPSEYDPYTHPDKNIEKRNTVLQKMYELGYINEQQYNEAAASDLVVNNAYREQGTRISSYFVDQVVNDVIRDLQVKKGYSQDFATQQVYNGGLKIYSTVDVGIQQILEDVYYNVEGFPYTGRGAQSAMIITDPYTGQVKGLIGGLGEKTDVRGFNRATQAARQPGSSIKPLSVYGPAIDLGKITESTSIIDEEITIGNDNWKPKNSYDDFYGAMTAKEAVARSSNIPAVKVLDMVGLSTSYGYLQNKFHLSSISDEDKNYSSLALGGLTNGVSPKEMAAAYGVFVNSGKYIEPYTYTRVEDSSGQVLLENAGEASQSISAAAAYITSDMLYAVVNSGIGTAKGAKLSSGIPTYGKTGTTDDDCDKWFVGFTPYYVGAVWYGFDTPSSISSAGVSGNPCVTAWNTVMERVHESLSLKELTRPTNVVEATICTYSGMLASSSCNADTAYFVDGTQPKQICTSSHSSGVSYNASYSGSASDITSTDNSVATLPPLNTSSSADSSDSKTSDTVHSSNSDSSSETDLSSDSASGSNSASGSTASSSSDSGSTASSSSDSSASSEASSGYDSSESSADTSDANDTGSAETDSSGSSETESELAAEPAA